MLPWVAVTVAVWLVLTTETVAANVTLVAPDGTVTEAGTATAVVLLDRFTTSPFVGAAMFVVTMQVSLPAPVNFVLAQLNPLRAAVCFDPLPCNFTVVAGLERVLVITFN